MARSGGEVTVSGGSSNTVASRGAGRTQEVLGQLLHYAPAPMLGNWQLFPYYKTASGYPGFE